MIIDPETTFITLTTTFKFDSSLTTKDVSTLQTNVLNAISSYNTNTLESFTGMFRYSEALKTIDNADTAILSNITKVRMYKFKAGRSVGWRPVGCSAWLGSARFGSAWLGLARLESARLCLARLSSAQDAVPNAANLAVPSTETCFKK